MQTTLHHQPVVLLPDAAVYLPGPEALVLSDVHLGKAATFRARGLPVPEGDTGRDLGRIQVLVEAHRPERLVIAGDLFHAPAGISPDLETTLEAFLSLIRIPLVLVCGNHDAKLRRIPGNIATTQSLDLGEIHIVHNPEDAIPGRLNIAGHLHPVVKIPDGRRTSLRLPCFHYREETLVLPSFGSFTGGAIIHRNPGDRVFVALRGQVIELPGELGR